MSPDHGDVDGTAPGTREPDQGPHGAPDQGMFVRKVGRAGVLKALDDRVKPGQYAVIIDDGYGRVDRVAADPRISRVIDARTELPTALDGLDGSEVVIYACTQDDIGLPFIEHLHRTGRRYYPVACAEPGGYAFTNTAARAVLEAERAHQRQHGFAKWDFGYRDFENLIQALEITRRVPGCYLEVGCYRGSSAGVVLRYLAKQRRAMNAWFLDVFDGFRYIEAERSADAYWQGTHATEGLEAVRARLLEYGVGADGLGIAVERCNIITDPLPQAVVEEGIAVANLDVDLHEAVHAGLTKIAPHVVKGGILVVEDPGHTPMLIGARLALDMFLRDELGKQFVPVVMQSGQTFLLRREGQD